MSRRVYSKMYLVFDVRQSNYEDLWLQARRYEVWMWVLSREQRVYEGGTVIVLFLEVGSGRQQRRVGTTSKVLRLRDQVRKDFWTDGVDFYIQSSCYSAKSFLSACSLDSCPDRHGDCIGASSLFYVEGCQQCFEESCGHSCHGGEN